MRFTQRPVLCVDAFVWTNNGVVNLFWSFELNALSSNSYIFVGVRLIITSGQKKNSLSFKKQFCYETNIIFKLTFFNIHRKIHGLRNKFEIRHMRSYALRKKSTAACRNIFAKKTWNFNITCSVSPATFIVARVVTWSRAASSPSASLSPSINHGSSTAVARRRTVAPPRRADGRAQQTWFDWAPIIMTMTNVQSVDDAMRPVTAASVISNRLYHSSSGVLLKIEVGIRKGAWRRAWRYRAYLWSLRWVYAVKKNPGGWYTAYTCAYPPSTPLHSSIDARLFSIAPFINVCHTIQQRNHRCRGSGKLESCAMSHSWKGISIF